MSENSINKKEKKRILKKIGGSFLLIIFVFIIQSIIVILLTLWKTDFMKNNIWFTMLISQIVMLIVTFTIITFSKRKMSEFGFIKGNNYNFDFVALLGLCLGFITVLFASLTGAKGMEIFENLSSIQIIFVVWIFAPLSEEILLRGLIQTYLNPLIKYRISIGKKYLTLPVLLSGFFFAAMHLPILAVADDILTVIIVVGSGFIVGIVIAYYREKSGSLIPAIAIHTFANIGGYICEKLFDKL